MKHNLKGRRESVKSILTEQLERGTKPVKKQPGKFEPMTDSDVKRIKKDITILEGPITKYRKKNRKFTGENKG